MNAEENLKTLLQNLNPKLNNGEYVFVSLKNTASFSQLEIICEFKEAEGSSLVLERATADRHGLSYDFVAAWITLTVHSSLSAVGLTAAVSTALTHKNISCNIIAGYFHDHLFVPIEQGENALSTLMSLC